MWLDAKKHTLLAGKQQHSKHVSPWLARLDGIDALPLFWLAHGDFLTGLILRM